MGEIEHQLQALPELKQAVVLTKEDATQSKYLVAYIVLEEGNELDSSILQRHLKAQLPDYMVPRFYMQLTELPLTANGKLDRGALPNPDGSALQRQVYVAPRTELEQALVSIWQEVLEVEQIGVYDDFFELGGHSLMAIKLIKQINTRLATHLEISVIYESPTIDLLNQHIKLLSVDKAPSLLVKIKQGSGNSTLFYAPPLAGTLFQAFDLGKFLHSEFTFYGFQQCDLIHQQYLLFESIEEMASAYVDELLKLERTENLYLMGYSFGATVAYEMLLQLQKRDINVSKLIVLDKPDPSLEPLELRDSDMISMFIPLLKEYARSDFDESFYEAIKEKPWVEVSALICNAVPFLDKESLKGIARVTRRNSSCCYHPTEGYSSPATSIDVLMAKEIEQDDRLTLESDLKKRIRQYRKAWGGFTDGAVNIIPIEGTHASILSSQHIEKLAEIINGLIPIAQNPLQS